MPTLEIKNLSKEYNLGTTGRLLIFNNLNFIFTEKEEFLTILAPFGSGKTTLLKIISGLEKDFRGQVLLNGNNYLETGNKIIYIPEKPSSFPWLSVKENLSIVKSSAIDSQIENILKLIGLEDYSEHYPDSGSVGFRFRIAVGRALVLNPAFILIDDSLKLLDSVTKSEIYKMLRKISAEVGLKFLIATTDISEAVNVSDRIIILKKKPTEIAGEYSVNNRTDKKALIDLVSKTLAEGKSNESINFTI